MVRSTDIMTQLPYESTYLGSQHILHAANNSFWARQTKATKWANSANFKSRAHLATLPLQKPQGFRRRLKCLWDT